MRWPRISVPTVVSKFEIGVDMMRYATEGWVPRSISMKPTCTFVGSLARGRLRNQHAAHVRRIERTGSSVRGRWNDVAARIQQAEEGELALAQFIAGHFINFGIVLFECSEQPHRHRQPFDFPGRHFETHFMLALERRCLAAEQLVYQRVVRFAALALRNEQTRGGARRNYGENRLQQLRSKGHLRLQSQGTGNVVWVVCPATTVTCESSVSSVGRNARRR